MLDIVFSDSACGSLKAAEGMDNSGGVVGFHLALSVGDISEDVPNRARHGVLCGLCHFTPALPAITKQAGQFAQSISAALKTVLDRSAAGEPVRLWYSSQPDELCGFYWMTAQLDGLQKQCGPIHMVRLPPYEQREDGTLVIRNGWGEVSPDEWSGFLPFEQRMSPAFRRSVAAQWRSLQRENAPLRAELNGRLVSAPEGLYDHFIREELARASDEFQEANIIGNVIGRFQLGVSDGWIASRIEAMIEGGELEVAAHAPDDAPDYNRILRKR